MNFLFDFDGTLIDSTSAIVTSFKETIEHFNLKPEKDIKSFIGSPLDLVYEQLGVERFRMNEVLHYYRERYRSRFLSETKLLDSAKAAILEAFKHGSLALVTTKTTPRTLDLLDHLGIARYFKVVIGREDTTQAKPSAEPVLRALCKLYNYDFGSSFSEDFARSFLDEEEPRWREISFMIGDTTNDIQAGINAGIIPVATLFDYQDKSLLEPLTGNITNNVLEAVILSLSLSAK